MKKTLVILALFVFLVMPTNVTLAQGPTPTATSELGSFGNLFAETTTPTATPTTPANTDLLKQALAQNNYVVVQAGNWYDEQGNVLGDSVYVMMLAAATDPTSDNAVRQIASGFSALRAQYPNAATYHVLMLNGPFVHDASTTSRTLQLLSTQLVTPDAFIKDVLQQMRTTNLVKGAVATNATATATPTTTLTATATATATRVGSSGSPTRTPTRVTAGCNAPKDQARLLVKNGYSGTMRFTVGAPDVGFQKDFDIPADGQFHFIDMPPSDKYTYSASIPGVGKASAKLGPVFAGQCYNLTFQP